MGRVFPVAVFRQIPLYQINIRGHNFYKNVIMKKMVIIQPIKLIAFKNPFEEK